MTHVAILGAAGKMGFRITTKLVAAGYEVEAVDLSAEGRKRLTEAGVVSVVEKADYSKADVVILAVPDTAIGSISANVVPQMRDGSVLLILDAAAPYADMLPNGHKGVSYVVAHPCHPPLFNDEQDMAARRDYHGGLAKQSIVCALMRGSEEAYELGARISSDMWSPVTKVHRMSLEQIAILEPGLSEVVALSFVEVMYRALAVCERRGIERAAAQDFLIGHLNVELAMWMGYSPKVPSDAALRLLDWAIPRVVNGDWEKTLEPQLVREASELIVQSAVARKTA